MTNQQDIDRIVFPICDVLSRDAGFMASGMAKEEPEHQPSKLTAQLMRDMARDAAQAVPSPLPELVKRCKSLALQHAASVGCAQSDAWKKHCEEEALFWAGCATALSEAIGDDL